MSPAQGGMSLQPPAACSLCDGAAKYRCPRCDTRSCSLACVQGHKEAANCDGRRDKTKFKAKCAMDDMDVVSDFRLLEEVGRGLDQCRRDQLARSTRQGTESLRAPRLEKRLQKLQQAARARGVRLRLLPPHFQRSKENTSVFEPRERRVVWRVAVVWPGCPAGPRTVTLPAVGERTKAWRLLQPQLEGDTGEEFLLYRGVSYGGLSLFLKAEGLPGPGDRPRRFYPLDMRRSLRTNLRNTCLVEHPIIYVVLKADEMNYREEQDLTLGEEEQRAPAPSAGEEPALGPGDVMSETDAMMADPEAYKQYFDFYLKYYSAKYSVQAPGPGAAPAVSHPAQLLLRPPARAAPFPPGYVPNFNRPPPGPAPAHLTAPPPSVPATNTALGKVDSGGLGLLSAYSSGSDESD